MKNYLLIVFVALMLVSCGNDDTGTEITENTPPVVLGHNLHTVTTKSGNHTLKMFEFADNKMVTYTVFSDDVANELYQYTYNTVGDLSAVVGKLPNGYVFLEREILYDSLNRIIERNDTKYDNITQEVTQQNSTFTYDDTANTISAFYGSDSGGFSRIFHFNEAGLVSFIDQGFNNILLTYQGNNITNVATTESQLYTGYGYTSTEVKGEYLNMYRNQFSSYINFVIYWGFPDPEKFSTNYISGKNVPPTLYYHFSYDFDIDGYPIMAHELLSKPGATAIDTYIAYQ